MITYNFFPCIETITPMIFYAGYIDWHRFCVSSNQETKNLVITIQKKVIDIRPLYYIDTFLLLIRIIITHFD